jgi:hypothetical protein
MLDPTTWKAMFVDGLRARLPSSLQADLVALSDAVWECAAELPPDEAALIASRYIEDEEVPQPWCLQ